MISRRNLIASAGLIPAGALLTRCASTTSTGTVPQQVLNDVTAALTTLSANLTTIATTNPTLIPAATMTTIQTDIATAQQAVATISAQTAATAGASVLQTVEGYLNAALNTLAAIPLIPAPFSTVIMAAALIAPEIEAFVASVVGTPTVSATPPKLAFSASGMTVAQARAVLGAAVVK
jgi:hypothetical protein